MARTDPFDSADDIEIDVQIDEIFAELVDADRLAAVARADPAAAGAGSGRPDDRGDLR